MRRRFALLGLLALVLMSTPWADAQSFVNPDVNRDNVVNKKDVDIVKSRLNKVCNQTGYLAAADVNGDCRINLTDQSIVSQNVGLRITGVASPTPNAAGWNNSNVTVTFTCAGPFTKCQETTSQTNPFTLSTEGAKQFVQGEVFGKLNARMTRLVGPLNLDKTAPGITITSPDDGFVTSSASIEVTGTLAQPISPLVSLTCNGVSTPVVNQAFSCNVPLQQGKNVIEVVGVDTAGNKGTASRTVQFLTVLPPTITANLSVQPNAAGWHKADVTISFTCTNATSCASPLLVNTEGANQKFEGSATGPGGTVATSVIINLDKTPPNVAISVPAEGAELSSTPALFQGTASDALSGLLGVVCEAVTATVAAPNYSCSVPLSDDANAVDVVASDVAGNSATATRNVTLVDTVVDGPALAITSPAAAALFNASQAPITVEGTTDVADAQIVVQSPDGTVNGGITGPVAGGFKWVASNVKLREGHNLLTAKATNPANGGVSTTALTVNLDTTPPIVRIDGPNDGATLTETQALVTGVVNDIVPGTVNQEQVTVTVNGIDTNVSNRTFSTKDQVLLVRGVNTLTAVATDQAGNSSQTQINVTVQDAVGQQRIVMRAGNLQSGKILTQLSEPLIVQLLDANGQPVADRPVTFEVSKSDGVLNSIDQTSQLITIQSDANGEASVQFRLGSRTGVSNNQVLAKATGFAGDIVFTASATVGQPTQINRVSGENQRGQAGQPLPFPFVVIVYDEGGNPVKDVEVTFKVLSGGGSLEGQTLTEFREISNGDGKADALLMLGQQEGVNNQIVEVTFPGGTSPAVFSASAVVAGNPDQTTVSGVVLNNADQPLVGAKASIVTDLQTVLEATTDAAGRFSIANAPVGTIMLLVDGGPASPNPLQPVYPFLAFVLTTVAGTDNTVGMPIYIPSLDSETSKVVGGDTEEVLAMQGVPGVAFKVAPNSVTRLDGTKGPLRMVLSQVHADKVPMPPPNGSAPSLVWTLQPAGVKFDPPIEVQLPNTDGLAPGQVVELYQFDHDLEQFVSVGQARVSADGSVITSDPGFGITKSGWGAPQPPPPPKNCTASCNDNNKCTSDKLNNPPCACEHTPTNEGAQCGGQSEPGPNSCRQGECIGGVCVGGQPAEPGASCDDGLFCTDPDKCGPGGILCFGEKIADKQLPKFEAEYKLGEDIKGVLNKVKDVLGLDGFEASVTVKLAVEEKQICCEQKKQKDVSVLKRSISGNGKLETPKLFIPGWGFNARAVKIGVFVKLGLGAEVKIEGEEDKCTDNTCYGGSITIGGSVEGGVAAEDEAKIISVSGSCGSGLEITGGVTCKEYNLALQLKAFSCKVSIELFDGYIAYNFEKELLPAVPIGQLTGALP